MSNRNILALTESDFPNFDELCAVLYSGKKSDNSEQFPLRGVCTFRSNVGTRFTNRDFNFSLFPKTEDIDILPLVKMNMLTLAGPDGALPWWVAEKIQNQVYSGGSELHQFLDLLNRRFWEILFMSSGCGQKRHIQYANIEHYEILDELSFGLARTPKQLGLSTDVESGQAVQSMRTLAYSTGANCLNDASLKSILEAVCKKVISIHKNQIVRLPVSEATKLCIGTNSRTNSIGKTGSVLGAKALTYSGMIIEIFLKKIGELKDLFPFKESKCMSSLISVLSLYYGQCIPYLILKINTPYGKDISCLGSPLCTVGWGATISLDSPASTIITIVNVNPDSLC